MSDCGFENPKPGFQVGSTLLSPAKPERQLKTRLWCRSQFQFGATDCSFAAFVTLSW